MTTSFEIGGTTITFDPNHEPSRQFDSDMRERVFRDICRRIGGGVWESEEDVAPNACMGPPTNPRPVRVVPIEIEHDQVAIRASVMDELADDDGVVLVSLFDEDRETTTEPVLSEAVETVETVDPVRYDSVEAAADPVDEEPPEPAEPVYLIRPSEAAR